MKWLLVMILLAMPWAAKAEFVNGYHLLDLCDQTDTGEARSNIPKYNTCVGYLVGLSDADSTFAFWETQSSHFCVPEGATASRLRSVTLRYLEAHSKELNLVAASLVLRALREAWPCSDEQPTAPASEHGATARAQVQEGTNLSNPAQTALGIACAEGTLRDGMTNLDLGLPQPRVYGADSDVVDSLTVNVDAASANITIIFKQLNLQGHSPGESLEAGHSVIYSGTCTASGITWRVSGTMPEKYLPKGPKAYIRAAQEALTELGYDPGPADGVIGKKTRAAVSAFQRARGMNEDGTLTPELGTMLQHAITGLPEVSN